MQDLVDPVVVAAQAEVAGLEAQRLAHGEERIEHELLRHDAERAPRGAVVGRRRRGPSRARVPRSARTSPARIEISVVLPAPFGPSRPKNSPGWTVEIDARERLHAAVATRDSRRLRRRRVIADALGRAAQTGATSVVDAVDARQRRRASPGRRCEQRSVAPSAVARRLQREQHGERRRIGVRRGRRGRRRRASGSGSARAASSTAAAFANVSAPANVQRSPSRRRRTRRRGVGRRVGHFARAALVLAPRAS